MLRFNLILNLILSCVDRLRNKPLLVPFILYVNLSLRITLHYVKPFLGMVI